MAFFAGKDFQCWFLFWWRSEYRDDYRFSYSCISIFMHEVGMIVTVSVFCSAPSAVRDIHAVSMPCDRHNPAADASHGFEIAIQWNPSSEIPCISRPCILYSVWLQCILYNKICIVSWPGTGIQLSFFFPVPGRFSMGGIAPEFYPFLFIQHMRPGIKFDRGEVTAAVNNVIHIF